MQKESMARFLAIPEHLVERIDFLDKEGRRAEKDSEVVRVVVQLRRCTRTFRCACGRVYRAYYDCRWQEVRDLPWGPWVRVWLRVRRFRVGCLKCGVRTEALSWLWRGRTYTRRLADAVALACREVRSIAAIAQAFQLSWGTVKAIDKEALQRELDPPKLEGLRHLALDEFSIRRRHTYGTIFLDVERNRVLWVCATREKAAVVAVFRNIFGKDVCAGIKAVSLDWWEGYEGAVRECLPNARIVWDLFHVVKKYNLEVIDRVRLNESARCQTQEEHRTMKKTKFLLLKNRANLVEDEPARLRDLLAANRRLFVVYVLRDALKKLWDYTYPRAAAKWFAGWYQRAIHSRIAPLQRFARSLKARLHGILAHCKYPINSGVLEGINNKVKVIKRIAYGYRDYDYFFLKIRAHFMGANPL